MSLWKVGGQAVALKSLDTVLAPDASDDEAFFPNHIQMPVSAHKRYIVAHACEKSAEDASDTSGSKNKNIHLNTWFFIAGLIEHSGCKKCLFSFHALIAFAAVLVAFRIEAGKGGFQR